MKTRLFFLKVLFFSLAASAYSAEWKQVINDFGPAVCLVEIRDNNIARSSGSGFLYSKDGMIITNAHVVRDAYYNDSLEISVSFELSSHPEKEYKAAIEKFSSELDLAVLKIPGTFQKYCRLGDSSGLTLMDNIMVIGYPLGKSIKATPGYVQAFQDIDRIGKMIDLSAAVDPGNSGGPVFDGNGKIIGIVTAKLPGMNFNLAIPVNLAKNSILDENASRKIRVTTDPEKARVFVNGHYKGLSPVEIEYFGIDLELRIEKDEYLPKELVINKTAADSGTVFISLDEEIKQVCLLKIESSPSNAIVLIDNNKAGNTPLEFEVPQNTKIRIRIIKSGYQEFYQEIETKDQESISLGFYLKK